MIRPTETVPDCEVRLEWAALLSDPTSRFPTVTTT